jgi:ABC-type lipoprotein release transport system permease subunit
MKLRKRISVIVVTTISTLAVIAGIETLFTRSIVENTKAQTIESSEKAIPTPVTESTIVSETKKAGVEIADKIKFSIKEKDTSWKLVKVHDFQNNASLFVWKSRNKEVRVHIDDFRYLEKAKEKINEYTDPLSLAVSMHIPVIAQPNFGDEAYLRDNYLKDLITQLVVRRGRYLILLDGEKEDLFHFANRILTVIDSH